jgi:N-acyl-D-aspartate/D-glutamate deacylase
MSKASPLTFSTAGDLGLGVVPPVHGRAADRRASAINPACLAPLTPFRHYVMGEASMERAVQRMTAEAADFFGIRDRGRLLPGLAADLVFFTMTRSGAIQPWWSTTCPAGRRMIVEPRWIEQVVVNGRAIFEGGQYTGDTPGRVLRS